MTRPWFASLLLVLTAGSAVAGDAGKDFRHAVPAAGIREVLIEVPVAELPIVNSTGAVEVEGTIRQKYSDREERVWAEEVVKATDIVVEVRGSRLTIRRTVGPEADKWRAKKSPSTIRAEIRIPVGIDVEIEQSIGEIEMEGSFGEIDIETRIGEVSVITPKRNIRRLTASAKVGEVHTDLGDRTITKEGLFAGETLYENETGTHDLRVRVQIGEIRIKLN